MTLLQIPDVPAVLPDSVPDTRNELHMLATLPADELIAKLISSMVTFAINLAIAVAVFYIGRFIIRKLYGLVNRIFERRHIDQSLRTFVLSMVKIVLYFILVVIVIGILGIETSSFLALFASAGVAVGMALSGTLQNFAGGVLILLLKPYRVGDYIEASGYAGTVREIQIFSTIINTADNKSIIIPNGGLSTGSINNWSRQKHRRVDWTVGVAYGTDFQRARTIILEILASNPDVLDGNSEAESHYANTCRQGHPSPECGIESAIETPVVPPAEVTPDPVPEETPEVKKHGLWHSLFHSDKSIKAQIARARNVSETNIVTVPISFTPTVVIGALADSSVNITVRVWVRSEKYWSVFYDINEKIYRILPENGIEFPFPQLDVHLQPAPK